MLGNRKHSCLNSNATIHERVLVDILIYNVFLIEVDFILTTGSVSFIHPVRLERSFVFFYIMLIVVHSFCKELWHGHNATASPVYFFAMILFTQNGLKFAICIYFRSCQRSWLQTLAQIIIKFTKVNASRIFSIILFLSPDKLKAAGFR